MDAEWHLGMPGKELFALIVTRAASLIDVIRPLFLLLAPRLTASWPLFSFSLTLTQSAFYIFSSHTAHITSVRII